MTKTNPKLIILAVVMLVLTLMVKIIPMVVSSYSNLRADRESLQQELDYYQSLIEEESDLEFRAEEAQMLAAGMEDSVFEIPENLFGSEIQAIIRDISGYSGVEVREMRVAKIQHFEEWVKISQELNFVIEQGKVLTFLGSLKEHQPRLYVSKFTLTRSRNQFTGALTVEAFSRHSGDYE